MRRLAASFLLFLAACATAPRYDLLIRNGRIVDGSGAPSFAGDVAVKGDTIVAIGPALRGEAATVIDAKGQVVSPGFIDLHTHARRGIFDVPTAENYVRQGVTTIFEGPDGSSPLPIREFLAKVEAAKPAVNFATFVGHGSIREAILGTVDKQPTAEELEKMKALAREAMEEGAFGLSTGLFYVPGTFAKTEEVIETSPARGRAGPGRCSSRTRRCTRMPSRRPTAPSRSRDTWPPSAIASSTRMRCFRRSRTCFRRRKCCAASRPGRKRSASANCRSRGPCWRQSTPARRRRSASARA
jgi:hypothetical protein